jgi:hypothetical protein
MKHMHAADRGHNEVVHTRDCAARATKKSTAACKARIAADMYANAG